MKSVSVTSMDDLKVAVRVLSKSELREMVIDIALRLSFDENQEYNPEESVAADCAADFVDSVTQTFHRNGISL